MTTQPDSGLRAKPPAPPNYPRGRVRDGLADRPSVRAEMVAFCNEIAAKLDALEQILQAHRVEYLNVCREWHGMSDEQAEACLADFYSEWNQ